jgi:hypothetical protein
MKIKNKLKQIGRKYLTPTLIGYALLAGCRNSEENPILYLEDNTKTRILTKQEETLRTAYRETMGLLESSVEDGYFSIDEQQRVLDSINNEQKLYKAFRDVNYEGKLNISKSVNNLSSLIKENMYYTDFGTPELEKSLRKNGLNVSVQPTPSLADGASVAFSAFLLCCVWGFLRPMFRN